MKILIIEDERKAAAYLKQGLTEKGFEVAVVHDGESGLKAAMEGHPDLIVLDIMLPGRDGWSILTDLRKAGRDTPTLFLTAKDAIDDRVKGLELGADDYLVKPFAFSELLARIRSILRRSGSRGRESIKIADLDIDLLDDKATRGGTRLELTPKEFALLALLARHAGEPLTRAFLARTVWNMESEAESNVVDVHVRRLRSKADDPFPRKLIHTVRGVGYVLQDRE